MMNYGFDGDQLDALEWAYATAYAQAVQAGQVRLGYEQGAKSAYPEWVKECKERLPKAIEREEELRKYAMALKSLIVTEKR